MVAGGRIGVKTYDFKNIKAFLKDVLKILESGRDKVAEHNV
jgi:hypothetical protein